MADAWTSDAWEDDAWEDDSWVGMGSSASGLKLGFQKHFRNKTDATVQPLVPRSGLVVFKRTT